MIITNVDEVGTSTLNYRVSMRHIVTPWSWTCSPLLPSSSNGGYWFEFFFTLAWNRIHLSKHRNEIWNTILHIIKKKQGILFSALACDVPFKIDTLVISECGGTWETLISLFGMGVGQ